MKTASANDVVLPAPAQYTQLKMVIATIEGDEG
jgi:hypothetical protein